MGNATSKAARKLPREVPVPATAPKPACLRPEGPAVKDQGKNNGDARDPYLTEMLNQLGPVRVDHHMQTVRLDTHHSGVGSDALKNRLLASSLTELLEARKSITNNADLETLAKQYHFDVSKLEQISQVVSTPSIDERMVVRAAEKHGEGPLTMIVHWKDPVHPR